MKKTFLNKKNLSLLILLWGCLFIFNGCGLDSYEVFESPVSTIHKPTVTEDSIDYMDSYFSFYTNEPGSASEYSTIKYLGTSVYYKIYKSLNLCNSEVSTLENLSNDTENSSQAWSKLTTTYSPLRSTSGKSGDVLIPAKYKEQIVYIRLTDYQSIEAFESCIKVDDAYLTGDKENSEPRRYQDDEDLSFNFGRYSDELTTSREVYKSGDTDVSTSTSSDGEEGIWYVSMFAVGVARDIAFTPQYSNILYLGTVKINDNTKDN